MRRKVFKLNVPNYVDGKEVVTEWMERNPSYHFNYAQYSRLKDSTYNVTIQLTKYDDKH